MRAFLDDHVIPGEARYAEERRLGLANAVPPVVEELKQEARRRGLWNLFLHDPSGLSNVDYAYIAELTGHSPHLAPEAINGNPPDSGNVELLQRFGSREQQDRWLRPLLDGTIRSAFAMTEPDVASSDPTNLRTAIVFDDGDLVVNGRKWWITGANDPRCAVLMIVGRSDPQAPRHQQHSIVLVPMQTPGVTVVRSLSIFGYEDHGGHAEIDLQDVRVPATSLLGGRGEGFAVAQERLGPGRIHHCMRAIGMGERALALMCARARERTAFGGPLSDRGVVREQIAQSRIEINQARLLVLQAAWLVDKVGASAARSEIAAIKLVAPHVALAVIDRAIQLFGAAGLGPDTPLAALWAAARTLRIVDGPDAVHLRTVARYELAGQAS